MNTSHELRGEFRGVFIGCFLIYRSMPKDGVVVVVVVVVMDVMCQ